MMSIRGRLTLLLAAGFVLLLGAGLAITYRVISASLRNEFDGTLIARARSIASLIEVLPNHNYEFEFEETGFTGQAFSGDDDFFQIWSGTGNTIKRSTALGTRSLPKPDGGTLFRPQLFDLELPNGREGRAAAFVFEARLEESLPSDNGGLLPRLRLTLAVDRAPLERPLRRILLGFVILALCTGGAAAAFSAAAVARCLAPLKELAAGMGQINPDAMEPRFTRRALPAELQPIAGQFNRLLERLKHAFERERRFSADAAHELRTPVAELRAMAEVALMWPDEPDALSFPQNAHQLALQMELLVDHLLQLARCQAGKIKPSLAELTLADVVEAALSAHSTRASLRGVRLIQRIEPDVRIVSDRAILVAMIGNLIGNAVAYSPEKSWVSITAGMDQERRPFIAISNPAEFLAEDDLAHLAEPFWRKEEARSSGSHAGLGLALVIEYSRLTGMSVSADLKDKILTVTVRQNAG